MTKASLSNWGCFQLESSQSLLQPDPLSSQFTPARSPSLGHPSPDYRSTGLLEAKSPTSDTLCLLGEMCFGTSSLSTTALTAFGPWRFKTWSRSNLPLAGSIPATFPRLAVVQPLATSKQPADCLSRSSPESVTTPVWMRGAEMMRGIGSGSDKPPHVSCHHGKEGADARGDRITHSAPAGLRGVRLGGGGGDRHADPLDSADRARAVLRLQRLRDLGPGCAQLDGAAGPGSAVGDLAGLVGGGSPSGALSALWGAHRAAALSGGQGALHDPAGGGCGPGL